MISFKHVSELLICLVTIVAIISSCRNNSEMPESPKTETGDPCPPISVSERWLCHAGTSWNPIRIAEAMLGTWEWKYSKCFFGTDDSGCRGMEDYAIEFRPDSMLVVLYNGLNVQTASWTIVEDEHDAYTIETEPAIYRLGGHIVICNDVIGFEELYIDGCNNYFKRKQ